MIRDLITGSRPSYYSVFDTRKSFDDLVKRMFDTNYLASSEFGNFAVDLKEDPNSYILIADIPGIKNDQIDLSYDRDILSLGISDETQREENEARYKLQERRIGSYSRTFSLPNADPKTIDAHLKDGVLTVIIQKEVNSKSKKIPITVKN